MPAVVSGPTLCNKENPHGELGEFAANAFPANRPVSSKIGKRGRYLSIAASIILTSGNLSELESVQLDAGAHRAGQNSRTDV
ncbi:MAG: hypothetical protein IJD06_01870, partial [Clostridia bacterium]|nr:hypothetical protein [Clostridia bacterium]